MMGPCGGIDSDDTDCFVYTGTTQTNPPNNPPGNPPPPTAKADLGFATPIWVEWDASPQTWVPANQPFIVYWTFGNFGGQSSGAFWDAYLVNDPKQWSSHAPNQMTLESIEYGNGEPAGSYMFEVYLDTSDTVDEVTNANNYTFHGITIGN